MSTDATVAGGGSEASSLVIASGNDRGRRISVPSTGIVLGREGKLASLFRDDPLVSRGHAHVYLAEDRSVQVADLNSANGTFVNGKAIRSLTRLTDRDVLRVGSIDMRLDSPRADNQPADETARMPAARASCPDPLAGRRALSERAWYEDGGRQSFPSAAAWSDAQAEAYDGLSEPPPASAAAPAPPDARAPAPVETTEPVSFAPHPLRLLAFTIDLSLVAAAARVVTAATGSLLAYAIVLLTAWVAYQTASVWLTGGRTIGKAACSLSVRHIDGSAPRQDRAGLAWAFGRASLGYLVIDMGGLGVLAALRSRRRRCLHDYAFASEVVLHPYTSDPLHRRGRLERVRQRLQQFTEDRESAWEAEKKKYAFVTALWKWLVRITDNSQAGLLFARDRWHALVQRLAATAHPATGAPAANALTAGKITALIATTSVATGTAVAVAATTYLAAPIVGNWGGTRITRVGLQSYQETETADFVGPRNGCLFPKGQEISRISGHGQHYTGQELWSRGSNGQDCRYYWTPATFDLIGTNTLKTCTTDPTLRDDPERCVYAHRVPGR
jgi:uncharacterized RDD family membrane protein YckC